MVLCGFTVSAAFCGESGEDEDSGGLFGGLKELIPSSAEELREKVDSAWEAGTEMAGDVWDSASGAREKIDELRAYLEEKFAGSEPAFTPEQVAAATEEVVPLIEELTDRKFANPPRVETVGTWTLVKALADDFVPQFEKRFPEVSKPVIYLQAYLAAGLMAPGMMGKYSLSAGTIYVVPSHIDGILDQANIPEDHREQILKLIIGHELVHCLQDQEVDLKSAVLVPESLDGMYALNATMEGQAVFVQNTLSQELKCEDAGRETFALFLADDLEEDAWLRDRIAHTQDVQYEQIYAGGNRFIAYHHDRGGMRATWEIMAHPPGRSSMITRPETYSAKASPEPDYRARFASLPTTGGLGGNWTFDAERIGDFQLRSTLSDLDGATREGIMRGLSEAVFIEMRHKSDLEKSVEVGVFTFTTGKEAARMEEALKKMTLQEFKDLERMPHVRLRGMKDGPYAPVPESAGYQWRYSLDAMLLGKTDFRQEIVRRKNVVTQIVESESGISDSRIQEMVGELVGERRL